MSFDAIKWARSQDVGRASVRHVLLVMATYAADDGTAYPSVGCLVADTGQNRKTVLAAIKQLLSCGIIADTGKRVGATKQVPVYRLIATNEQYQKRNSTEIGTVPKSAPNSTKNDLKQSQNRDTEQTRTTRTTRGGARAGAEMKKRATLVPENWTPSEACRQYAVQHGCPDIDAEVEAFIDYSASHGKSYRDHDAAWRTRCRNGHRFGWAGAGRAAVASVAQLTPDQVADQRRRKLRLIEQGVLSA